MRPQYKVGFTMIEAMLVLAITGLFIAGVIFGVGPTLNTQRYRDSLSSLQSVVQKQYSEVDNPSHINSKWVCTVNVATGPVLAEDTTNKPSGVSECAILGKYIVTKDNKTITIKNVVGITVKGSYSSDISALQNSKIVVSSLGSEDYELEWGASLKTSGGSDANFSILILRSPASGIIKTFINPNSAIADGSVQTLLSAINLQSQLKVCVKSDGSINSDRSAFFVNANASSASGVEIQGETMSGC